jgi:NADP-dependent 3-hydroxy acid dehydrogenase YdfG
VKGGADKVSAGPDVRTALVTGASTGIGAAIARAFGRLGWSVAIGARRVDRLGPVARDVKAAGGRVFSRPLDISDAASVDAFFDGAEAAFGPLEVVVNNAGIGIPGRLQDLTVEEIQTEIGVDLIGPMLVSRRALPSMVERRRGELVFITSANTVAPRPSQIGYTASKAGVEAVARTLKMELEGSGVRSIIVRPGPTLTDFAGDWEPGRVDRLMESWEGWGLTRHGGLLQPEDIAAAVVTAVTAPAHVHLNEIQIDPLAPRA